MDLSRHKPRYYYSKCSAFALLTVLGGLAAKTLWIRVKSNLRVQKRD